jgi:LCP family protein required for cell wall assembly
MHTNNSYKTQRVFQRDTDGFIVARRPAPTRTARPTLNVTAATAKNEPVHAQPTEVLHTSESGGPAAEAIDSIPRFDLPRYEPHERPAKLVRRRRRWARTTAKISMVFGVIVVLAGGYVFWQSYTNLHRVFQGTGTVAALSSDKIAPGLLKGEGDGRVNILLLGIGGQKHPGGDLTDTMVVLSVDPVNKTAAMLSIPRDLWVKMPVNYFGAYQKINAAYSSAKYKHLGKVDLASANEQAIKAGFAAADQAVGDVLGININYHVLVNFQAFKQAVDSVGGVSIDVATQLYDPTMAWENYNNPVLADVGTQNMDGKQALNYARSRETSSDFARNERQRQLLVALKEKVLTLGTLSNPAKITNLMDALGSNVHTDLSIQAASRLFTITKGIGDTDIASLSLTTPTGLVTTDRVGNISVVRPRAGFNTYSDIQAYVRSQLKDGYLIKEKASVYVVGATDKLRAQTDQTLKDYGYAISGSGVAAKMPAGMTIVDASKGTSPYTLHYLQDRYGLAATTKLPAGVEVPNGTQFVIIAGT